MKRYRIYTEDKNRVDITDHITQTIPGFTIYHANGYWKGIPEPAIVIEILCPDYSGPDRGTGEIFYSDIADIASWIKIHNNQESVIVTREKVLGGFI